MISDEKLQLPKTHKLEVSQDVFSYPIPEFIKGPFLIKWGGLSLLTKEEETSEFWDYYVEGNMIHFNEELFYLYSKQVWDDAVYIVYSGN